MLWDTNARINGLVAVDLETLVSQVLSDYPPNAGFANGLFVMTTATDHKNNLNSSALKKNYVRTLRVETIANSAGGTAEVAVVAQPSTGFFDGSFYPDGTPTEDTEDCLGRITVGLTRSKSLTLLVSPLDMFFSAKGKTFVSECSVRSTFCLKLCRHRAWLSKKSLLNFARSFGTSPKVASKKATRGFSSCCPG